MMFVTGYKDEIDIVRLTEIEMRLLAEGYRKKVSGIWFEGWELKEFHRRALEELAGERKKTTEDSMYIRMMKEEARNETNEK